MKCRHSDLEIPEEYPFENCCLNRESCATTLESIISNYADGFVLSINGEWGTGKTTFVKMWQANLNLHGFSTLYFNAWENDFISDPLIGLLGEFRKINKRSSNVAFNSLIRKGSKIALASLPLIAKGVAKKYAGEEAVEVITNGVELTSQYFKKEINSYEKKKTELSSFKDALKTFVSKNAKKEKPLVFIVDELDRCAPDYAVKVLERIKHLFSVEGIVYVLSIDKVQLANSVRGYYGSDLINAEEYLRRFIDIEYVLPTPPIEEYCKYLYSYFGFDAYFDTAKSTRTYVPLNEKDSFLLLANSLFKDKELSLRKIEKIFSHARVVLSLCQKTDYIYSDLLLLLIYFRQQEPALYNDIVNSRIKIQPLVNKLEEIFATSDDKYREVLAELLICYDFQLLCNRTIEIGSTLDKQHFETTVFNFELLKEKIDRIIGDRSSNYNLKLLTSKIDLLENIE